MSDSGGIGADRAAHSEGASRPTTPQVESSQSYQLGQEKGGDEEKTTDCSTAADFDSISDKSPHKIGVAVDDPDPNDDNEEVGFDVVGIHGLHGQSRNTWIAQNPDLPHQTWLAKAFSVQSNVGRVILYGYDANGASGGCSTVLGVYREAAALLESLFEIRKPAAKTERRPIYFVSHDIGGLIVKAALILASRNEGRFSDILYSTRAIVFFGYPHRPLTSDDLEEQLFRLMSLQKEQYHPGRINRLVRSYAETIIHVNGAFIHTNMLKQAKLVNLFSAHKDPKQRIFDALTAQIGIAYETRLSDERRHVELTKREDPNVSYPQIPVDEDWLAFPGNHLSDEEIKLFHSRISQASPTYPPSAEKTSLDIPELAMLSEVKAHRLIHIQCSCDAESVSERLQSSLAEDVSPAMPLYFRFDSHDRRFSNAAAMIGTLLVQFLCNRPNNMSRLIKRMAKEVGAPRVSWTKESMHAAWERIEDAFMVDGTRAVRVLGCLDECDESALWFLDRLRHRMATTEGDIQFVIITSKGSPNDELIANSLSTFPPGVVRRVEYTAPQPSRMDVGLEVAMLFQDNPRYVPEDILSGVTSLISSCSGDKHLCKLLMQWLKENPATLWSVPQRLSQSEALTPDLIFSAILAEIPNERQVWAYRIISWMLSSIRPLRSFELSYVSDLCLIETSVDSMHPSQQRRNTHTSLHEIRRYFGGILVVVNDEMKFGHSAIRHWLQSGARGWYRPKAESSQHLDILQTCLAHLTHELDRENDWEASLPYAIEFWTSHYKQAVGTENLLESFVDNTQKVQRWIHAFMALPSPYTKPHKMSDSRLVLAAHFGLEDLLQPLLVSHQGDVEARGQALIEAARAGQLPALRIIIKSYTHGLDYNDIYLHDAVQAASSCGNHDLFVELVNSIPIPPHVQSQTLEERSCEGSLEQTSPEIQEGLGTTETDNENTDEGKNSGNAQRCGDISEKCAEDSEKPGESIHWLSAALRQASWLGVGDVVSTLVSLGANPDVKGEEDLMWNYTPLHCAVRNSHLDTAKILIDVGANLDTKTEPQGFTLLHMATAGGADLVRFLLDREPSINAQDSFGTTPIQLASQWGALDAAKELLRHRGLREHMPPDPTFQPLVMAAGNGGYKMIETLIQYGADPNQPDLNGETALFPAVRTGRTDICRLLLQNKADPNFTPDRSSTTALILAVQNQAESMVRLLVEHGADIEKKEAPGSEYERTPLLVASSLKNAEIVEYLVSKSADLKATDKDDWSALYSAAYFGRTESVRCLAETEMDVNLHFTDDKETPLHVAVEFPETVRVLLRHGADVNKASSDDNGLRTPFDRAMRENQAETVKIMLDEAQVAPDFTLPSTQQTLQDAVRWGYEEVVSTVLEAGADVNLVDDDGWSLISLAVWEDNASLVRKILEYRPNLDVKDKEGDSPLHTISSVTPSESVCRLVNSGAQLTATNNFNQMPLIRAIQSGNEEVVRYLLTKKAVVNTLNTTTSEHLSSALHVACDKGNLSMVRLLIAKGSDINLLCGSTYGTPLVAATRRPGTVQDTSSTERASVINFLLDCGADPTIPAGPFAYPITYASRNRSPEIVQSLLEHKASIDVKDDMGRKPIHFACYNSLEVLRLLQVQDSDFASKDLTGRVPLHFAVLSGQTDLLGEVLLRSERVGIRIDVPDADGWTPLMWAARAVSDIYSGNEHPAGTQEDIVSFLLEKEADKGLSGKGLNRNWTAVELALYHRSDSVARMLMGGSSTQQLPDRILRGTVTVNVICDWCFIAISGIYFTCGSCSDYHLCYKCYLSKSVIHPQHEFNNIGDERYSNEVTEQVISEAPRSVDGDTNEEGEEGSNNQFDDEIIGEEEEMY